MKTLWSLHTKSYCLAKARRVKPNCLSGICLGAILIKVCLLLWLTVLTKKGRTLDTHTLIQLDSRFTALYLICILKEVTPPSSFMIPIIWNLSRNCISITTKWAKNYHSLLFISSAANLTFQLKYPSSLCKRHIGLRITSLRVQKMV